VCAILDPVLSYAAVFGAPEGIGHSDILAVIGDDGTGPQVIGEGNLADDLRDVLDDGVIGDDPETRIGTLTRGLSYFTVVGPFQAEGNLDGLDAIAKAHGI